MNSAAVLMNDAAKTEYTYYIQMPYLNMAINELNEHCQLNNVPITSVVADDTLIVKPGVTMLDMHTNPHLPFDLIEIQQINERLAGSAENYLPMTRREYLPPVVNQISELIWWTWQYQQVNFIGATTPRQLQLNYITTGVPIIKESTDNIELINSKSYLIYRTAALLAEHIPKDGVNAGVLNLNTQMALDRFLGINTKGKQAIATRRRPFMAAYKNRGW
jgi:hypothetical protein